MWTTSLTCADVGGFVKTLPVSVLVISPMPSNQTLTASSMASPLGLLRAVGGNVEDKKYSGECTLHYSYLTTSISPKLLKLLRWQNLYGHWKAIKCACTMIIKRLFSDI